MNKTIEFITCAALAVSLCFGFMWIFGQFAH